VDKLEATIKNALEKFQKGFGKENGLALGALME
jgi:hypothetical protein